MESKSVKEKVEPGGRAWKKKARKLFYFSSSFPISNITRWFLLSYLLWKVHHSKFVTVLWLIFSGGDNHIVLEGINEKRGNEFKALFITVENTRKIPREKNSAVCNNSFDSMLGKVINYWKDFSRRFSKEENYWKA